MAIQSVSTAVPPRAVMPATTGQKIARVVGWTLIITGIHILLYLSYLLWWTNLETNAAQADLLDQFAIEFGDPTTALPGEFTTDDGEQETVDVGDAYAAMWFERDGERVANEHVMYVVQGVDLGSLKRGPGHEPRSDKPGGKGNFVVSGHRTTYGAPFYNLDKLQAGDEVHVVDRDGAEWVYVVQDHLVVAPTGVWVTKRGAFGDQPTLTLTTCNPRFSAAERLIVWATLRVDDPAASQTDAEDAA